MVLWTFICVKIGLIDWDQVITSCKKKNKMLHFRSVQQGYCLQWQKKKKKKPWEYTQCGNSTILPVIQGLPWKNTIVGCAEITERFTSFRGNDAVEAITCFIRTGRPWPPNISLLEWNVLSTVPFTKHYIPQSFPNHITHSCTVSVFLWVKSKEIASSV